MSDSAPSDLLELAKSVLQHSYSPYSKFKVGVALRADNGQTYSGCNVENASFAVTQCAEANAIGSMIASGGAKIVELVLVTDAEDAAAPCGACRQIINEFKDSDNLKIYLCAQSGTCKCLRFSELLPHAFCAADFT